MPIQSWPGAKPKERSAWLIQAADPAHEGASAQCWSPDDRFIRAAAPGEPGADRTILLIPLDGTLVVEISTPGEASKGTCQMQRLAR